MIAERNQAIAQACAFPSPSSGSMSAIAILHQLLLYPDSREWRRRTNRRTCRPLQRGRGSILFSSRFFKELKQKRVRRADLSNLAKTDRHHCNRDRGLVNVHPDILLLTHRLSSSLGWRCEQSQPIARVGAFLYCVKSHDRNNETA